MDADATRALEAHIREVVEKTLSEQTAKIVETIEDCVCELVKAVCNSDPALYRPMLEQIAHRLGEV